MCGGIHHWPFLTAVARMLARLVFLCVLSAWSFWWSPSSPGLVSSNHCPCFFPDKNAREVLRVEVRCAGRELCKMGRVNKGHTAKGQKCGSNKVEKCSWPQGQASPPQEHKKQTKQPCRSGCLWR